MLLCDDIRRQHVKRLIKSLNGLEVQTIKHTNGEPDINNLKNYIKESKGYDTLIAIGGGSVLDIGKAMSIIDKPREVNQFIGMGNKITRSVKKILIPTTTGTGSESTDVSVFKDMGGIKVIYNPNMFADLVILDPNTTYSLSEELVASTCLDAFSHAIESCISINKSFFSSMYAKRSIDMIYSRIKENSNFGSRKIKEEMLIASHLAGVSFINAGIEKSGCLLAGCTLGHAIGLSIGKTLNISHRHAIGSTLPAILSYYESRGLFKQNNILNEDDLIPNMQKHIEKYKIDTLPERVSTSVLSKIVKNTLAAKRLLMNDPTNPTKKDVEKVIKTVFN